jgi:hypothetical protein
MQRPEIEILFSPEAQKEFTAIQQTARSMERDWARRYLEELLDFPPESWLDLRRSIQGVYFKSDSHVPFDIQGRLIDGSALGEQRIVVTRFRLRRKS